MFVGIPLLEHPALELVAVDEERGEEGLEARDAEPVEDTRPTQAMSALPALTSSIVPRSCVRITPAPLRLELDHAAFRPSAGRPPRRTRCELRRDVAGGAREGEHERLAAPRRRRPCRCSSRCSAVRASADAASTAATAHWMNSSRLHRRAPPLVGAFDATAAVLRAHRGAPSTRGRKAWGLALVLRKGQHGRRFSVAVRRFAHGASARALAGRDCARRLLAGDRARRAGLLVHRVVPRGCRGAAGRRLGAARLRPRVLEPASGECRRPAPGRSRLRLVSRRVGQPRRRLGRRFHDRPGHVRNLPGSGRLGDARLPGRPSGFLGGARRRRTCSCGSGTRARSAAGALLRSGDLWLCAMPGQSPARRGRARARRRRSTGSDFISAWPGRFS